MTTPTMIDKMLAAKAAMIPKEGYNLVGVDSFEMPGDELYLIGHFETREEAEQALARRERQSPGGDRMYIYGPDDC